MEIAYHYESDITKLEKSVIVHGCNAQGVMGSGVAKAIKDKWPEVYDEYIKMDMGGGNISSCIVFPGFNLVYNMITQEFYGKDDKKYVNYDWIKLGFKNIKEIYDDIEHPDEKVNIPLIGCGLAGGDWNIVSKILEESGLNIHVHILEDEETFKRNLKLKENYAKDI